jgi:hypothetical protein
MSRVTGKRATRAVGPRIRIIPKPIFAVDGKERRARIRMYGAATKSLNWNIMLGSEKKIAQENTPQNAVAARIVHNHRFDSSASFIRSAVYSLS